MAEMFLKLDGIEGESLDFAHAGEIEIKNWEWHTVNNVKWDVNQGGQSTKVEVKDIDLKKICDKASVTLYQCCVTGKHIKNGKITCRKNDGDQKVEYLIVTLTDIMVTKVDWIGEGGSPSLDENVSPVVRPIPTGLQSSERYRQCVGRQELRLQRSKAAWPSLLSRLDGRTARIN